MGLTLPVIGQNADSLAVVNIVTKYHVHLAAGELDSLVKMTTGSSQPQVDAAGDWHDKTLSGVEVKQQSNEFLIHTIDRGSQSISTLKVDYLLRCQVGPDNLKKVKEKYSSSKEVDGKLEVTKSYILTSYDKKKSWTLVEYYPERKSWFPPVIQHMLGL